MSQLTAIHDGLARVRQYRALARQGSAWSLFLSTVLAGLLAAFLLDLLFRMGRLERGIVLAVQLGLAGWAFWRFVRPSLRVREDDATLALLVEKRQGISSDLVAALQFVDGSRRQFGSAVLRSAVVDYVAELGPTLNFLDGFSLRDLRYRGLALAVAVAVWGGAVLAAPGYVAAFVNRLFLGAAHYPTRTTIQAVLAPGDRAAFGQAVTFQVRVGGVRPEQGRVELKATASGMTSSASLTPDKDHPELYTGKLERLMDEITYAFHVGDAYTEPRLLKLIPLPIVTVEVDIAIPDYARDKFRLPDEPGRQRIALEGSRAALRVRADKPLKSGAVTIDGKAYPLQRQGEQFVLAGPGTPLDSLAQTVRYEVQVVDGDDLSLERPIGGMIQVRPDNPPRIAVAALTRTVLPGATPNVRYQGIDEFGLARISLHLEIIRGGVDTVLADAASANGGGAAGEAAPPLEPGAAALPAPPASQPELRGEREASVIRELPDHPTSALGTVPVSLARFNLQKGDRVNVSLEAVDWRGALPGKPTRSELIVFEVTDKEGFFEAMKELDDQMNNRLDQIIRAQLGIGGAP